MFYPKPPASFISQNCLSQGSKKLIFGTKTSGNTAEFVTAWSIIWDKFYSSIGKESTCNAGDPSLIPGLGRSPGEGKGYPFQYSGLENSMDCRVHWVAKSWTGLNDFHLHFNNYASTFDLICK